MNLEEICGESSEGYQDTEVYESLLVVFRQVALHLQQLCSIPQGELTMMIAISRMEKKKGYVLPSEIQDVMRLSRPAISRMIHNLEKKGYLAREISDSDHRFVRVVISELGKEKMTAAIVRGTDILQRVRERMGEDDMKHLLEYNRKFGSILFEEVHARP